MKVISEERHFLQRCYN